MMLVVVACDVSTESDAGRKRLRRVAKVCEDVGQGVQNSVFECLVDAALWTKLRARLVGLEILMNGVSTRHYQQVIPEMTDTVDVSRSTVSRYSKPQHGHARDLRGITCGRLYGLSARHGSRAYASRH